MNRPRLAIVVALTDPGLPHLEGGLARFAEEAGPLGEVVVVDSSGVDEASEVVGRLANVRVIRRPGGRLAPELWRDGVLATDAELVALTTAQMMPSRGWIEALKGRMQEAGAAAVGGPIEPGAGLSAVDRAVALLRYSAYFPGRPLRLPLPPGEGRGEGRGASGGPGFRRVRSADRGHRHGRSGVGPPSGPYETSGPSGGATPLTPGPSPGGRGEAEGSIRPVQPPGDNALYRRDLLMDVGSSWPDGFWEVDVHRALLARGHALAMAERAVVTFLGGVGLASMARQRFRHGRRYGLGRSAGLGTLARWGRILGAPLVPPLLCGRALGELQRRGMATARWLPALAPLAWLATAWAIGEAVGTGPGDRKGQGSMTRRIREVA